MSANRTEGLSNRELLDRTVIRVRRDLATVQQLTAIVGINEEVPTEVTRALQVLSDYTIELLAAGRPRWSDAQATRPPAGRPQAKVSNDTTPSRPPPVEPGPLAARPRPRHPMRRTRR